MKNPFLTLRKYKHQTSILVVTFENNTKQEKSFGKSTIVENWLKAFEYLTSHMKNSKLHRINELMRKETQKNITIRSEYYGAFIEDD